MRGIKGGRDGSVSGRTSHKHAAGTGGGGTAPAMMDLVADGPAALAAVSGGKLAYANSAFFSLYHLATGANVRGRPLSEFFDDQSVRDLARVLRRAPASAKNSAGILRLALVGRRNGGDLFPCDCWWKKSTGTGRTHVLISLVDSTEARSIVDSLTKEAGLLSLLRDYTAEALAVVHEGIVSLVNPAFLSLFGFSSTLAVVGKKVGFLDGSRKTGISKIVADAPSGELVSECRCRRVDGSSFDARVIVQRPHGGEGSAVVTFVDLTEEKRREQKIQGYEWGWRVVGELSTAAEQAAPRGVLDNVVSAAVRALSCHSGALYLMNDSGQLQLGHTVSYPETLSSGLAVMPAEEGFGGFAVKTREPLLIDVHEYPSFLPYRALFEASGIKRMALVPLTCDERVVGVFLVASRDRKPFPDFSSDLLRTIGRQVGGYVDNLRSYEKVRHMFEGQRALVESLPDVVYSRMPDGSVLYVSPAVERLLGYTQQEFGRTKSMWLSMIHPEDRRGFFLPAVGGELTQKRFVAEYRMLPKRKAEYRWIRDACSVIEDESGTVAAIHGILSEVVNHPERDFHIHKESVPA